MFSGKKYLLDNFLPNRSLCSLRTHKKEKTELWESTKAKGQIKSEWIYEIIDFPKK